MEKGLRRWADDSHWLDDQYTGAEAGQVLPKEWRLGNRPNLKHMHDQAEADIDNDVITARLLNEICKPQGPAYTPQPSLSFES